MRHTLEELRDQHVVKQALDYSCGAAALATLMIYYFGDATSEQEILTLLQAQLTEKERKIKAERGFSLLDLKRVARAKGYRAAGFKLTVEQLMQLAAPVMVFVEPFEYKHFAVVRGIDRGRVYIADPSRGNLRMSIDRFLGEWGGIVFVLGKPGEENIRNYPLLPPHPAYVQPELLGVIDMQDQEIFMRNLPLR
jgi:predicted double-glycine peptidase